MFWKSVIKGGNWVLFGISVVILMATVYNATLGRTLDLTAEYRGIIPGALIVAGIVTTSWLLNSLALKLRLVESGWEWWGTAFVATTAFVIDIYILLSLVFSYHIPQNVPLIVVMGHAGMHFVLWMTTSYDRERREGGLLAGEYVPPELEVHTLRQQVALLEVKAEQLEASREDAQRMLEASREAANRTYTAACEVCGKVFEKPTQLQADKARDGHMPHCKGAQE